MSEMSEMSDVSAPPASASGSARLRVLIVGGGVAGLECALALAELAPGLLHTTVMAPNETFVYRPLTVREPFGYPRAERYQLGPIVRDAGAELLVDALAWVDPARRVIHTRGEAELGYDVLVLALGARIHPRYTHAITIDDRKLDGTLQGLLQDIEGGYARRIAFVAPARMPWPLPLYELALMTAGRAYDMNVPAAIEIITPEDAPLALFGAAASDAVEARLQRAGIHTTCSAYAEVPRAGEVVVNPGDRRVKVDRVIALPELYGPSIRGIPLSQHGFIRVSPFGEALEVERVFAAGDCTDFPVKHGGVSAQQADAVAESIAALAGAPLTPQPFHPVVQGKLLTDSDPLYLTARITGGNDGFASEVSDEPQWSPGSKIASRYLSPYLDSHATSEAGRAA